MGKEKINLNINTHIICLIIQKARVFLAKEGVVFPEPIKNSENEYDWAQVLADHKDDLTFREVQALLHDLEPDQRVEILALFYLGREDFEINAWQEALKAAKERLQSNFELTAYLFSKPQLPEYLENALDLLGFDCEDFRP